MDAHHPPRDGVAAPRAIRWPSRRTRSTRRSPRAGGGRPSKRRHHRWRGRGGEVLARRRLRRTRQVRRGGRSGWPVSRRGQRRVSIRTVHRGLPRPDLRHRPGTAAGGARAGAGRAGADPAGARTEARRHVRSDGAGRPARRGPALRADPWARRTAGQPARAGHRARGSPVGRPLQPRPAGLPDASRPDRSDPAPRDRPHRRDCPRRTVRAAAGRAGARRTGHAARPPAIHPGRSRYGRCGRAGHATGHGPLERHHDPHRRQRLLRSAAARGRARRSHDRAAEQVARRPSRPHRIALRDGPGSAADRLGRADGGWTIG